MNRLGYDVVVVGAGGAGAPLAARLSARGARVLLVEAGPVPAPLASRNGASLVAAMPGHPLTVSYAGTLFAGRNHTVVRGRAAGGSTAINGGYFRRPREVDLASWAARAEDPRWNPEAIRPLWAEIEADREFGVTAGHGVGGPLPITRGSLKHPISAALLAAGSELSLPLVADQNSSPDPPAGIGPVPTNTLDGERWSTARAWLEPSRTSLEVRGGCTAIRVVLSAGHRVRGLLIVEGTQLEVVSADRVVLCAGAIATPQLLLRSGIGPADLIRASGAPVLLEAPVGARLYDHPQLELRFTVPDDVREQPSATALGVVAIGVSHVGGTGVEGDIEVLSVLRPLGRMLGTDEQDTRLSLLVSALRTDLPGRLILDPHAPPSLDFRYLSSKADRARMRAAVRMAAAMLASDAVRQLGGAPDHPQLLTLDDHDLDSWMRAHLSTALHSCGTTPMGTDPSSSVVDGRGAVHGIEGLHIADLGILPTTPSSGPAASAVLVGHVIAEAV